MFLVEKVRTKGRHQFLHRITKYNTIYRVHNKCLRLTDITLLVICFTACLPKTFQYNFTILTLDEHVTSCGLASWTFVFVCEL